MLQEGTLQVSQAFRKCHEFSHSNFLLRMIAYALHGMHAEDSLLRCYALWSDAHKACNYIAQCNRCQSLYNRAPAAAAAGFMLAPAWRIMNDILCLITQSSLICEECAFFCHHWLIWHLLPL